MSESKVIKIYTPSQCMPSSNDKWTVFSHSSGHKEYTDQDIVNFSLELNDIEGVTDVSISNNDTVSIECDPTIEYKSIVRKAVVLIKNWLGWTDEYVRVYEHRWEDIYEGMEYYKVYHTIYPESEGEGYYEFSPENEK